MSEPADLDELARRYLDLWQDQMSALATDEDFARMLQQLMTSMGLAAATSPAALAAWPAMMAGLTPGSPAEPNADGQSRDRSETRTRDGGRDGGARPSASGAAAAAASSDGGLARLDELAERLAGLEQRLAALEAGAGGGRRRAPARARKRRT
ncbi:MAG TPA: hypothetical protein VLL72_03330 [Kiloniellales bacterium]|nr:hypothetical protein [Kiloniellales bacterium]